MTIDIPGLPTGQIFSSSVQLFLAIAAISLLPIFLMSVTAFLRIIIVFSMARTAIGTNQIPPNIVLTSLAIFMTIFIMSPIWQEVYQDALLPYQEGKVTQMVAIERGFKPLQNFMIRQTRESDLGLFVRFARIPAPKSFQDIPFYVVIPSFMMSELRTAFQIGFVLFIPFLIIDMVVSNILLSLGMFMLSPVIVSLPFKVLLFILADGWNLIASGLLRSFL